MGRPNITTQDTSKNNPGTGNEELGKHEERKGGTKDNTQYTQNEGQQKGDTAEPNLTRQGGSKTQKTEHETIKEKRETQDTHGDADLTEDRANMESNNKLRHGDTTEWRHTGHTGTQRQEQTGHITDSMSDPKITKEQPEVVNGKWTGS